MMIVNLDDAIENVSKHIEAQVNVLNTGRGIIPNAAGLNDLIEAKKNLLAMKGVVKKAPVASVEGLTCEHCGTTGLTKAMYGRWHGDKCSKK